MRVLPVALFLLCVALAGCMGSERPAAPRTTPEPESGPGPREEPCWSVVIVDEELLPIVGARLTVDEVDLVVPADATGRIQICDIPHGTYHLAVEASGYDTARKTAKFPDTQELRFTLRLLPVLEPYHEVVPKSLFHTVSLSALDATVGRFVPLNDVACNPCSFDLITPSMPDFVFWEARWSRSPSAIPSEDQMFHLFRGGTPFENAPGETANRDIGSGSMTQPFRFQYHRNDMMRVPIVAEMAEQGAEVRFSGAMYCWGNPPVPCINQRIDVYLTVWYNILKVPDDYTALPGA